MISKGWSYRSNMTLMLNYMRGCSDYRPQVRGMDRIISSKNSRDPNGNNKTSIKGDEEEEIITKVMDNEAEVGAIIIITLKMIIKNQKERNQHGSKKNVNNRRRDKKIHNLHLDLQLLLHKSIQMRKRSQEANKKPTTSTSNLSKTCWLRCCQNTNNPKKKTRAQDMPLCGR